MTLMKSLFYIYQQNLSLLETQMELVKSTTFKNIGIYEWEKIYIFQKLLITPPSHIIVSR